MFPLHLFGKSITIVSLMLARWKVRKQNISENEYCILDQTDIV